MAKAYSRIHSIFTDQVQEVGAVRRVFLRMLVVFVDDVTQVETLEWHYFGSTLAAFPLSTYPIFLQGYPAFEHVYISFPQDFDQLGTDAYDAYYNLGAQAGLKREGLRL